MLKVKTCGKEQSPALFSFNILKQIEWPISTFNIPLVGEHISLGLMCFLGRGTQITRDMCFLGRRAHITRDMCFLGRGTHISRDVCFPCRGTHITREMCLLGRGTHITRDMCFPGRGTQGYVFPR